MSEVFYDYLVKTIQNSAPAGRIPAMDDSVWMAFLADRKSVPQMPDAVPENPVPAKYVPEPDKKNTPRSAASPLKYGVPPPLPPSAFKTPDVTPGKMSCCSSCDLSSGSKPVHGAGNIPARVMFIGAAPDREAAAAGVPFAGPGWELLQKMASAMKLPPEAFYYTVIVKCFCPAGPSVPEADACIALLRGEIAKVRPEVIVFLGAAAVSLLFDCGDALGRIRGTWIEFDGIPAMPTFHPSFLLREPEAKRDAWNDLKQVMRRLNVKIN